MKLHPLSIGFLFLETVQTNGCWQQIRWGYMRVVVYSGCCSKIGTADFREYCTHCRESTLKTAHWSAWKLHGPMSSDYTEGVWSWITLEHALKIIGYTACTACLLAILLDRFNLDLHWKHLIGPLDLLYLLSGGTMQWCTMTDQVRVYMSCTSSSCCSKMVTGNNWFTNLFSTLGSIGSHKSRLLVVETSVLCLEIGLTSDLQ